VNERWGGWSPITWNDVQVADVNGDGKSDVIGRTSSDDWWVAKSTGMGFVNEKWGYWSPVTWLDINVGAFTTPSGASPLASVVAEPPTSVSALTGGGLATPAKAGMAHLAAYTDGVRLGTEETPGTGAGRRQLPSTPEPQYRSTTSIDQYFAVAAENGATSVVTRVAARGHSNADLESILDEIAPEIVENIAEFLRPVSF